MMTRVARFGLLFVIPQGSAFRLDDDGFRRSGE
jgi:hypothetical protein